MTVKAKAAQPRGCAGRHVAAARHRGFESPVTSARGVVDRRANDPDLATHDHVKRHEVSALSGSADPVEAALAHALDRAAEAGRFVVVAQLAKELEARRLAHAGNVVALAAKAGWRGP